MVKARIDSKFSLRTGLLDGDIRVEKKGGSRGEQPFFLNCALLVIYSRQVFSYCKDLFYFISNS